MQQGRQFPGRKALAHHHLALRQGQPQQRHTVLRLALLLRMLQHQHLGAVRRGAHQGAQAGDLRSQATLAGQAAGAKVHQPILARKAWAEADTELKGTPARKQAGSFSTPHQRRHDPVRHIAAHIAP